MVAVLAEGTVDAAIMKMKKVSQRRGPREKIAVVIAALFEAKVVIATRVLGPVRVVLAVQPVVRVVGS
jgi:hypothetical protein